MCVHRQGRRSTSPRSRKDWGCMRLRVHRRQDNVNRAGAGAGAGGAAQYGFHDALAR